MVSWEPGVTGKVSRLSSRDLFATPMASRIEMRLLSETRSVFEYLPKPSLYAHACRKEIAVILQFSNKGRSCEVDSQRTKIRAEGESYGHTNQFSCYIDARSAGKRTSLEKYPQEISQPLKVKQFPQWLDVRETSWCGGIKNIYLLVIMLVSIVNLTILSKALSIPRPSLSVRLLVSYGQ